MAGVKGLLEWPFLEVWSSNLQNSADFGGSGDHLLRSDGSDEKILDLGGGIRPPCWLPAQPLDLTWIPSYLDLYLMDGTLYYYEDPLKIWLQLGDLWAPE